MTTVEDRAGRGRRVVVAGGTGLIGRALVESFLADGWAVDVLTRDPKSRRGRIPPTARVIGWSGRPGDDVERTASVLAGAEGVVNLSGTPIAPLPWTKGRRAAILGSRVASTTALVEAMASLPPERRPAVLANASGADVYVGRADMPATEATPGGHDFLSDVITKWEAAATRAEALGVRVVLLRTAFVLGRGGPALRLLTLPFRLFVGGPIGSGEQWFSWVHIDDAVGLYRAAIVDPALRGPINGTAPESVRQRDLARAIGRAMHRPTWFPTPALLLRLVLRDEATLVLDSRRVAPAAALAAGYVFRYPDLDQALADVL